MTDHIHHFDRYIQFLTSAAVGADHTRHSGRTLFDHLVGTMNLLMEWGNSPGLQAAGLFHSIYGTRAFRHQSWPLDDRATIKLLIGDYAEELAHAFGMLRRPHELFKPPYDSCRCLRELETANLIEQGSRNRETLRQLYLSNISHPAKMAIAKHFQQLEDRYAQVPLRS